MVLASNIDYSSYMNIYPYMIQPFDEILIVVLVLILFLFVLALILFRESLESCCCPGFRRRRAGRLLTRDPASRREPLGGLRNPGFDEQERSRRLPEQRPFDAMEQVESPPSYDEAVKQELFRFQPPPTTPTDRSYTPTEGAISEEDHLQTANPSEDSASACAADLSQSPPSLPSTSRSCTQSSQKWGSLITSGIASQLSTISEEDHEDWPVTVVIDCIGVQASRLLENCDTTVSLTNGSELATHSKC